MSEKEVLKVVCIREGGVWIAQSIEQDMRVWIAQAIEQDMCAQAREGESAIDAVQQLGLLFDCRDLAVQREGGEQPHGPVAKLPETPVEYRQMYDLGKPLNELPSTFVQPELYPLGDKRLADVRVYEGEHLYWKPRRAG